MKIGIRAFMVGACVLAVMALAGAAKAEETKPSVTTQHSGVVTPRNAYCARPGVNDGDPCPPCQNGKCIGVCQGGMCVKSN